MYYSLICILSPQQRVSLSLKHCLEFFIYFIKVKFYEISTIKYYNNEVSRGYTNIIIVISVIKIVISLKN